MMGSVRFSGFFLTLAGGTGARAAYAFRLPSSIVNVRYYFYKAEAAHSCPQTTWRWLITTITRAMAIVLY